MQEVDKTNLITIREGRPNDAAFILATWLRGLYYGDTWFSDIPKDTFMSAYHRVLENILNNPTVSIRVACLKEDPEVILGYAVLTQPHMLHWVFVKHAWRKIGIAKSLTPPSISVVTHLTKVGRILLKRQSNVHFNPFAL